ncbi:relaxase domain-containing protein [Acetobacter sp. P1H12_c]|uniref:relaxase domain-containing protein n=1 Tax=Acetobacter sp. P1H12_c TaxID=2762621 RepID=UPI00207B4CB7|nr:relaxase domain-containing protein [Acetobacter sp. P1H12_c]
MHGQIAEDQRLGTHRDGEWSHRPGWDLTFSAPKSVSVMAEVAGDRRLIDAHEAAMQRTLALAEQHMAATRIREDGDDQPGARTRPPSLSCLCVHRFCGSGAHSGSGVC